MRAATPNSSSALPSHARAAPSVGAKSIVRDGNLYTFSPELLVQEDARNLGTAPPRRPGRRGYDRRARQRTRGDYLPGYYANWVESRRLHLQEHTLLLLTDLLPRLAQTQRHLIPTYAKLAFKLDPCHEPSYLELIRYHLDNRNHEQARRQYGSYQAAIRELGLEPSPQLTDLIGTLAYGFGEVPDGRYIEFSDY